MPSASLPILVVSREDRRLVREFFNHGPDGLAANGMLAAEQAEWLARPAIQAEIRELDRDYQDRNVRLERSRYYAKAELSRMLPLALSVYQRALLGFVAGDEGSGKPRNVPPTKEQMQAARDVFVFVGAPEDFQDVGDITVHEDKRSLVINDPSLVEPDSAQRRSRIRSKLSSILSKISRRLEGEMPKGGEIETRKKKKKRKKVDGKNGKHKKHSKSGGKEKRKKSKPA